MTEHDRSTVHEHFLEMGERTAKKNEKKKKQYDRHTNSMSQIRGFFFFFFLGIIKYDDILYDHLQNTGQNRQQEKRVLPTTVCKTAKINVLIFVHSIFKTLF